MCRQKMSTLFNEIYTNEEILPPTHAYIYIYIYIYVCVCVCVCVSHWLIVFILGFGGMHFKLSMACLACKFVYLEFVDDKC